MKKILFSAAIFISSIASAQAVAAYQTRVNQVTQANISTYVNELVALGIRSTGSTIGNNAFTYLNNKYLSFGYTASQITTDNFTYTGTGTTVKNLIVTKTGTLYPDQFVIICGHYDSVTAGVGANDNGSGVALMLEMARILKDVPTDYSIKFINFTGEEQGLLGSAHFVSNVVNATTPKMKIRLVFNLDMIGGIASQTNNSIFCEADRKPNADWTYNAAGTTTGTKTTNDLASYNFTKSLKDYVTYYSTLTPVPSYAYNSDYMPFENNGEIVCGIYERPTNTSTGAVIDPNPYYHKSTDIISNFSMPYVYQITRAAVGAMQHFAIASTITLGVNDIEKVKNSFQVFPNPAKDVLNLEIDPSVKDFTFEITDESGRLISASKNLKKVDISSIKSGVYLGTVNFENQKISKKIIIK